MRQWTVLYRKEWLEMIRAHKLLWMPLVFILFGAMQPVTTYFLPDILAHAGNMPEGTVISIPAPSAAEMMADTLGQFNSVGLLILALVAMNMVSGERSSGLTAMILVKPVSYRGYIAAKWAALVTLVSISFAGGFAAAYYYTAVLFDTPDWRGSVSAFLFYWLWLVVAGTVTLMFSAFLRSGAAAAACALGSLAGLSLLASLLPHAMKASPGMLAKLASARLLDDGASAWWPAVAVTVLVLAAALEASAAALRRRPAFEAR